MAAPTSLVAPLRWDGSALHVLDQTRLPGEEVVLTLTGAADTADAIRRLVVRGAPMIGIAAAYGLAMEVARTPTVPALERAAALLAGARPTARNLGWAVERVRAAALAAAPESPAAVPSGPDSLAAAPAGPDSLAAAAPRAAGPHALARAARTAAEAIHREDEAASRALSRHGAEALDAALPPGPVTVLTHCNTGALAASGRGTGLGVIADLAERRPVDVLACEARPLLQGARLTVWELRRLGIEHALLVDAAAAGLIRTGAVQAVVTGFDRVAANGDVANKVGTYGLALAAAAAGIPFVVAGPSSSVDLSLASGDEIEIEERDAGEVRAAGGALLTIEGTACRNPAFDVTPAELVWALVTERGTAHPVSRATVATVA